MYRRAGLFITTGSQYKQFSIYSIWPIWTSCSLSTSLSARCQSILLSVCFCGFALPSLLNRSSLKPQSFLIRILVVIILRNVCAEQLFFMTAEKQGGKNSVVLSLLLNCFKVREIIVNENSWLQSLSLWILCSLKRRWSIIKILMIFYIWPKYINDEVNKIFFCFFIFSWTMKFYFLYKKKTAI